MTQKDQKGVIIDLFLHVRCRYDWMVLWPDCHQFGGGNVASINDAIVDTTSVCQGITFSQWRQQEIARTPLLEKIPGSNPELTKMVVGKNGGYYRKQ